MKGELIVISGPSGAGKSTVIKNLIAHNDRACFSISATTRPMRPEDSEGVTYYFKSREEFQSMISRGELLEYAEYVGNFYGTPRREVVERLESGMDVFLDIEVQGAEQIHRSFPEAVLIFLTPPSLEALERRLRDRNDLADDIIARRLETARREYESVSMYDYIVINDKLATAVSELEAIVLSRKCRVEKRAHLLK